MNNALPAASGFACQAVAHGEIQTRALGARVATRLLGGEVLLLHGPLGAGKTCFVQGLAAALEVTEEVVSPTFTLAQRYQGRLTVHHLDFFRIATGMDLADIGVEEILDEVDAATAVLVVEWPALLVPLAPRRVEFLALPGTGTEARIWHWRGIPALPTGWAELGAGLDEVAPNGTDPRHGRNDRC